MEAGPLVLRHVDLLTLGRRHPPQDLSQLCALPVAVLLRVLQAEVCAAVLHVAVVQENVEASTCAVAGEPVVLTDEWKDLGDARFPGRDLFLYPVPVIDVPSFPLR